MMLTPMKAEELDALPYGTVYVKIEVVQVGQSQGYPEHYTQAEVYLKSDATSAFGINPTAFAKAIEN